MEYLESKLMDINPVKFVKLSQALLFTISVFLFPNHLYAVGLSDIKVLSSIGEEFVAEVELIGIDPDDPEIIDYINVSIEPVNDSLPGIKGYVKNMSVDINLEDGKPKLLISHPDLFKELFIEFSIFFSTGGINILRTYTAILDFPESKLPKRKVQTTVVKQPAEHIAEIVDLAPEPTQMLWQDDSGSRVVRPGETLYKIALELQRQYGGNINQIMDAIFADNSRAFINNDRNLILAGAPLNLSYNPEDQSEQFDEYGPVQAGDTLFQIARRYRHQYDTSMYDLANQIFDLNKQAFIRDDINLLRQNVMLKLPPHDGSATSVKIDERDTETIATKEVIKDGQYLEILTPSDIDTVTDDPYTNNIIAQTQQKLGDSLINLEEGIRLNSELKYSIELGTKQINDLQQNLDASNAEIDELKAQIDELKNQSGDKSNTQSHPLAIPGEDLSDGVAKTTKDKLITKLMAHPWTVIIIIFIVGIAIVMFIIMLLKMNANQNKEQFGKEYVFRERVSDNILKARIKQKFESS